MYTRLVTSPVLNLRVQPGATLKRPNLKKYQRKYRIIPADLHNFNFLDLLCRSSIRILYLESVWGHDPPSNTITADNSGQIILRYSYLLQQLMLGSLQKDNESILHSELRFH